jgi:hypothetical protein
VVVNHTPGPWYYGIAGESERGPQPLSYRGPGYYDNAGVLAGSTTIVGCDEYDVFGPYGNEAEREANVRLICAAPDLLAALVRVIPEIATCCSPELLEQAREAIAKAEGKS